VTALPGKTFESLASKCTSTIDPGEVVIVKRAAELSASDIQNEASELRGGTNDIAFVEVIPSGSESMTAESGTCPLSPIPQVNSVGTGADEEIIEGQTTTFLSFKLEVHAVTDELVTVPIVPAAPNKSRTVTAEGVDEEF
jgi:hypothetical protein